MARRRDVERLLTKLLDELEPQVRAAVLESFERLRSDFRYQAFLDMVRARNIEAAITALALENDALSAVHIALQTAYNSFGALQSNSIPPPPAPPASPVLSAFPQDSAVVIRWDMTNPRAEQIIRTQSSTLITNIVEEQRENVREALTVGYAQGQHPDTIARDIAGRLNRATGKREGGIIGLSNPQARHVASMRSRLASGDPSEMAKVFEMQRRDKRFDGIIRKAIADGKPLARADIEQITRRYSDRLLALRAETIARTETGQAQMLAKEESMRQALGKTNYPDEAVTKEWRHGSGKKNARKQHKSMHGKKVRGMDTPFVLPDGTRMKYPLDRAGGVEHNANCRCTVRYSIDYSYGLT